MWTRLLPPEAEVARTLVRLDAQLAEMEANPAASKTWRGAANTYEMWASARREVQAGCPSLVS